MRVRVRRCADSDPRTYTSLSEFLPFNKFVVSPSPPLSIVSNLSCSLRACLTPYYRASTFCRRCAAFCSLALTRGELEPSSSLGLSPCLSICFKLHRALTVRQMLTQDCSLRTNSMEQDTVHGRWDTDPRAYTLHRQASAAGRVRAALPNLP